MICMKTVKKMKVTELTSNVFWTLCCLWSADQKQPWISAVEEVNFWQ